MENKNIEAEVDRRLKEMQEAELDPYTLIPLRQIIMDNKTRRRYGSLDGATINPLALSTVYEAYGTGGSSPSSSCST